MKRFKRLAPWGLVLSLTLALGYQIYEPKTKVHDHEVMTFNCNDCANTLAQFIAAVNSRTK